MRNGIVGGFFKAMGGVIDKREMSRQDKIRTISYRSVDGVLITDDNDLQQDTLFLKTSAETYRIYEHFMDTNKEILAGINMGIVGKLHGIWLQSSGDNQKSAVDVPELIKKLADLRAADIITEQEFQEKKKKLLSQI
jgi:hypothetical protein